MGDQAVSSIANVGDTLSGTAVATAAGNGVDAQTVVVNGLASSGDLTVGANFAASQIEDVINAASATTGVTATASNSVVIDNLSLAGTVTFDLSSEKSTGVVGSVITVSAAITTSDFSNLAEKINDVSASTGVSATLAADKQSITLSNETGDDIVIEGLTHSTATNTLDVGGVTLGAAATTDSLVVGGKLDFSAATSFVMTSDDTDDTVLADVTVNSKLNSVADVNIGTQTGANDALSVLDQALRYVSDARADLGAIQNRLETTISNLGNVVENVTAARSRVQDADFAMETAALTRGQILQQAGVAMLAQANAAPQAVLALLQ
jgi:flagellin